MCSNFAHNRMMKHKDQQSALQTYRAQWFYHHMQATSQLNKKIGWDLDAENKLHVAEIDIGSLQVLEYSLGLLV